MINAWSLLYDELYEDDEMSEETFNVGAGNTASAGDINLDDITNISIDTSNYTVDFDGLENDVIYAGDTLGSSGYDTVTLGYDTLNLSIPDNFTMPDDCPSAFTALSDNDDAIAHHVGGQVSSGINNPCARKYKEDESIEALKNYISTTYGGHYTSDTNDVQTLDLIESVGDAESFCRSNAIKYLSRYDKKGQAKRDILKALHYSLLLYHFSGQLNETPTRGYETF